MTSEVIESIGSLESSVEDILNQLEAQSFVVRLWQKDPSLWKQDGRHQALIKNRLGWLDSPKLMLSHVEELIEFTRNVCADGFTHVLHLGMGGSSLAPEVIRSAFGVREGFLKLHVLDSTSPDAIRAVECSLPLERTLFVVATKSGTTTETLTLYQYFYDKIASIKGSEAGKNFVALTDPDTPLVAEAQAKNFRHIFLNPPDIGGRYSALSYFGLLPAALIGVDIKRFLSRAIDMQELCGPTRLPRTGQNPGIRLGAILGAAAKNNRDKVTFIVSPESACGGFGSWLEQLLAESTGKEGTGIIPINGEQLGVPEVYGPDRLFVDIRVGSASEEGVSSKIDALRLAGHPVVTILLNDLYDLGQEFYRWEFAVATAGAILGINAFDEPNVQESKDMTREMLATFAESGSFPAEHPRAECGSLRLYADDATFEELKRARSGRFPEISFAGLLEAHFHRAVSGSYFAFMAYLAPCEEFGRFFDNLRVEIRKHLHVATTFGYGPRLLHSTGQLHKGGPNTGIFLQITAESGEEVRIPNSSYTFGVLLRAQALGDLEVLRRHQRRVIRIDLGENVLEGLNMLMSVVKNIVRR
ncbi:MAG: bifunctional transaldolase/phosoglucose isomerase [Bacteroidota bacterium]